MVNLLRIVIGAAISFVVLSLLYGVNQAGMLVGVAVICTAGIGLIPIVGLSWMVGWIVLAVWEGIAKGSKTASVP
jgi:hypothetical protein